jgi:pimeloyl-ACP methyl ester carboxylesterase
MAVSTSNESSTVLAEAATIRPFRREGAQAGGGPFNAFDIPTLPVAVTVFPAEIYQAPRSWGERSFGNLIHWNEVDKGGHFAAWEQPELFAEEIRAAFRSLR